MYFIIDFAVPEYSRIEEMEKEKIEAYQDLRRELQKIWHLRVKIMPLVVGSLGAIPQQFGNKLKETGITAEIGHDDIVIIIIIISSMMMMMMMIITIIIITILLLLLLLLIIIIIILMIIIGGCDTSSPQTSYE